VPVPDGPDTSWAGELHTEATSLSRQWNGQPVGSRVEAERLSRRVVYGDQGETALTGKQAAAEIEDVLERNSDLRSLGGGSCGSPPGGTSTPR
jgi:hypothetical protein